MKVAMLCLTAMVSATPLLAQTTSTAPSTTARPVTVITIGEETIEGEVKGPVGFISAARPPRSSHQSLVRPRIDFRRELLSSVASL